MKQIRIGIFMVFFCATGCASVRVTDRNGQKLDGIEYYPPKPYILVLKKEANYEFTQFYLPDYSTGVRHLDIRPNLGSANAEFTITDGWRLSTANIQLDSKFADNLNASGALLGALASGGSGSGTAPLLEFAKPFLEAMIKSGPAVAGERRIWIFEVCLEQGDLVFKDRTPTLG